MLEVAVSGSLVGKSDSSVLVFDKDNGGGKTFKIKGRYLYVKKCVRPEIVDGVAMPEKTRQNTSLCLVLAVGDGCGKPHKLTHDEKILNKNLDDKMFEIVSCTAGDIKVGDKVFFPSDDPYGGQKGISRTTYGKDEFLIHECLAIGALEE